MKMTVLRASLPIVALSLLAFGTVVMAMSGLIRAETSLVETPAARPNAGMAELAPGPVPWHSRKRDPGSSEAEASEALLSSSQASQSRVRPVARAAIECSEWEKKDLAIERLQSELAAAKYEIEHLEGLLAQAQLRLGWKPVVIELAKKLECLPDEFESLFQGSGCFSSEQDAYVVRDVDPKKLHELLTRAGSLRYDFLCCEDKKKKGALRRKIEALLQRFHTENLSILAINYRKSLFMD